MANHLDLEEQEQLDQLKHFWATWGTLISSLLTIVLLGLAGWNGYQFWQARQATQASALYDAIEAAAARELAAALQAVIRQLGFEGETPTAFGGSLLVHNNRIANAMRDHLLKDGCQLEPFTLAECPAEGAVNMALQHLISK